jgi:LexA-binding, inner membrane-associated putative hydrolase
LDNLTHSLFGLTLARTPLGRGGRATTVALLLASNAPDIDIVATAGGAARYLQWHRGPTHGPLGIVGLGLLVAAIVAMGDRWWPPNTDRPRARLGHLWIVSMIAVAFHVLMDLPTSYGTRTLSPFAWTWFAEDWEPIVDIYVLAILGAGLWFGRARTATNRLARQSSWLTQAGMRNAAIALTLMVVNYGVRAVSHHEAIVRAPRIFGAQLPGPCHDAVPSGQPMDHWPRTSNPEPSDRQGRCLVEIAATPDFLSPFRWRLIAHLSDAYEVRRVDLLSGTGRQPASNVRIVATHYPNVWTPAIRKAAQSPAAQTFLGFSRFPAARSVLAADGTSTVRWTDLRFDVDNPGPRERAPNLFGATVHLSAAGVVLEERLGSR